MKLLARGRRMPRAKTIRPAQRYLAAGAEEARRLGHRNIGTEHILKAITRHPDGRTRAVLTRLGTSALAVEAALAGWLPKNARDPKIDAEALAELGIDFDAVRARLEQTFGPGALERSHASCLGICPRLKLALAFALDHAAGEPLDDVHVLLGLLSVPDSVAAHVLVQLGVTHETVTAVLAARPAHG